MRHKIERFAPGQTALVCGILYGIVGVILMPFFMLGSAFAGGAGPSFAFALMLPVIYGVGGGIITAISCALYNLVAGWVGGIEVELEGPVLGG
jgi:hypothetical protein